MREREGRALAGLEEGPERRGWVRRIWERRVVGSACSVLM